MFHDITLNNKINKLHERALRIVYKNDNSSFQDNSITIHQRNLQRLAIEMYKVEINISPIPMQELFTARKKEETTLLKNYRQVSLIPVISKLFERDMYNQYSHILTISTLLIFLGIEKDIALSSALSSCWNNGKNHWMVKVLLMLY